MGYTLKIGEFWVDVSHEDRWCRASVQGVDGTEFGAPENSIGDGSRSNEVWPSYPVWHNAMATLGIYEVFYGDGAMENAKEGQWQGPSGKVHEPLIDNSAGAVALHHDHLVAFEAALERWEKRQGMVELEGVYIGGRTTWYQRELSDEGWAMVRTRARWLVWWTRWALQNCDYPTFSVS